MRVSINASRCPQNHPCPAIRSCPSGALTKRGYAAPEINPRKCTDCGRCTRYCAFGVIKGN